MRVITASFIAMATGWGVLNLLVLAIALALDGLRLSVVSTMGWFGFCSAIVVGIAWFMIYLPVYAFVPRRSEFWEWKMCIPVGAIVGALVPFGLMFLSNPRAAEGGAVLVLLMPATVGAVAAAVGRWLVDWSRNYEECERRLPMEGKRIPWLRV